MNYTVWIPTPGERQQTISEPSDQHHRLQTRRGMDREWGSPQEGSDYNSRGSARGLTWGNKQQNLEGLEQRQARLQQRERPIRDRKQWRSRSKDRWEDADWKEASWSSEGACQGDHAGRLRVVSKEKLKLTVPLRRIVNMQRQAVQVNVQATSNPVIFIQSLMYQAFLYCMSL